MSDAKRRVVLFLALAGAVGWSAWLALNEPATDATEIELVEPTAQSRTPVVADPVSDTPTSVKPGTTPAPRLALSTTNLFPEQTWYIAPPPPPPPAYVPPPPPQAPALPFTYMGRWQEADKTTYYLTRGTLPVSVQPNQILDGVWRLEPVTGRTLNFTYLPLNQTRSLRTGE